MLEQPRLKVGQRVRVNVLNNTPTVLPHRWSEFNGKLVTVRNVKAVYARGIVPMGYDYGVEEYEWPHTFHESWLEEGEADGKTKGSPVQVQGEREQ
jgi:hypothetical protein